MYYYFVMTILLTFVYVCFQLIIFYLFLFQPGQALINLLIPEVNLLFLNHGNPPNLNLNMVNTISNHRYGLVNLYFYIISSVIIMIFILLSYIYLNILNFFLVIVW